jgi:hypothetical protein
MPVVVNVCFCFAFLYRRVGYRMHLLWLQCSLSLSGLAFFVMLGISLVTHYTLFIRKRRPLWDPIGTFEMRNLTDCHDFSPSTVPHVFGTCCLWLKCWFVVTILRSGIA